MRHSDDTRHRWTPEHRAHVAAILAGKPPRELARLDNAARRAAALLALERAFTDPDELVDITDLAKIASDLQDLGQGSV